MLSRYGEAELDESGNPKHFLAKVEIDPAKFGAACRPIGVVWQDGERYVAYESIKGSSQYDSAEMSRFLDGHYRRVPGAGNRHNIRSGA